MRKGHDGEKRGGKREKRGKEKTDDYGGHYVIASSRPPERRPLERRTRVPILVLPLYALYRMVPSHSRLHALV